MNEFRFWRWAVKPERPTIMHVVEDAIPGAVTVELSKSVAPAAGMATAASAERAGVRKQQRE